MTDELMLDSINPALLNGTTDEAGYVDGWWQTAKVIHGPHVLTVAVFASDNADALDVEPGDATTGQAPGWVDRQHSLGDTRPAVYGSVSEWPTLIADLAAHGAYRSWTAHYDGVPHRCTRACNPQLPAGWQADATQWTDNYQGRNVDASNVAADFWDTVQVAAAPPAPTPTPPPPVIGAPVNLGDENVQAITGSVTLDGNGAGYVDVPLPTGKTKNDVVNVEVDEASPGDGLKNYPDRGTAEVDYQSPTGVARVVFTGWQANHFYTFRVFVA